MKQRLIFLYKELKQLPRSTSIPIGVGALLAVSYVLFFVIEKPVQFSYAGETCIRQMAFFPKLSKPTNDAGFRVEARDTFKVGSVDVLSPKTCFIATKAPQPGFTKVSVAPFGSVVARKTFAVTVPALPGANANNLTKPVPIGKPLKIPLTTPDTIYDYKLHIDDKNVDCSNKAQAVSCTLDELGLEQGKDYQIKLARSFQGGAADTLVNKKITTLSATNITKAGITQDQTIYERPTAFAFDFDKEVTKATVRIMKIEGTARSPVEQTVQFAAKKATITLSKELDRNTSYEIEIDKLSAQDGSTLTQPYKASFKVSGGPKLTGANVKTSGAGLTQTVILTFDQPLSDAQDITKFASLKGLPATSITKKDNQILVSYAGAPKCADFTITLAKGLESKYQIPQAEVQNFSSRTVCYSVQTIGYSKGGRPIQAFFFGNGGQSILFVGAFHGNERNSKAIMDSWVSELETKAKDIPATRQVVVVPVVNPDGVAANRRNNNNNVDLNRNFSTSNWQKDISSPSNQPIAGGGGASPMSEPETQVIAALTSRLQPRLTLSYHSVAGYAIGNEAGDSAGLAATYSQLSGYRNMTGNGGAFDYSTTGTYEDWIAQKLGLPSLIIELASSTNSEFARNKSALWTMVRS